MKKSFSKALSILLVLVMVLGAMPVSAIGEGIRGGRDFGDFGGIGDFFEGIGNWFVRPTPIFGNAKFPAQTITGQSDGVNIVVEVPEGSLPAGTTMTLDKVEDLNAVQAAVDAMHGVVCSVKVAVDITFYCGGVEVQPRKDVIVNMTCDELRGIKNLTVVHLDADIDDLGGSVDVEEVDNAQLNNNMLSFKARHFSIYAGGDGANNTRVTVDFYPNENITDSNRNNRQIVLVSSFTGGNTPVYDPGLPNLGANQAFGGWKLVGSGTAPAGFEYGKTYTVNKINEILIANAESYNSAFTLSFAAVVEDVVFVSYTDQNGVVWKTEAVPLNHSTYGDFTYDSDNFAPEGQNVGLVGWVVMFENGQATGYVVEDTDDAADFKYKVADNAPYGAPGSAGTASNELVLYPLVKSGQWIYFNANIGTTDTTPATYTAPRFIADGETPNGKKPADPTRAGYTFAGWYTNASCTTAFNWSDENWTSQLTGNTVYAKWTANSVSYKVIYWTQNRNDDTGLSNSDKSWDYYVPTATGVVTSGTANAGSTVTLTSSTSNKTAYNRLGRNDETYSGRAANGELGYYFKFNSAMTETSKVIRGDGTTVFNVYYDRATLTINFYQTRSSSGTYSNRLYQYIGLYEHDWTGYPSLSSSYTWKYYDPNDSKTYILTSGTAPTVFKSFQSCTETWNIHRDSASSWTYSSPIYYRRQALDGSYVLYREDDLCADSSSVHETQYIRGNEFFGFTGVGYNANTNSMTASSYHTFTANDSGDYPLSFNGYQIYSYGINIYYQRNQWIFDYYSNGTTYHANNGNKIYFEDNISSLGDFTPTNGPEGYYFTGWYKDPECTKPYTFSGTEAKMPNNDVLVYAGWEPEYYRIVFDLTDGGNVDPTTIVIPSDDTHPNGQDPTFTVVYGTKIDGACLSKVTTTTGLTFGGWFYDAAHTKPFSFETLIGPNIPTAGDPDGMDMTYATASDSKRQDQSNYWKPWSDVGYPAVRGKLVLYPLWRQKVVGSDGIQVRYDAVDGDGLIYVDQDGQVIRYDPFTYTDGALAFTRYSATPNDNGEQFLYWEILDKNGNVVDTVYPGETFPVNLEWAVAEPTRPTYTITWHYCDDNGNGTTVETTVFEGDIPTHSAPAWDDGTYLYEFSSWNSAQDGSGTAPVAAEANADYYAQYTQTALPAKYTVTFEDWDGTTLATQTVYEGHAATAPADPTRTGYTFTGWSPADFTNVTSDMTITAQYSINSYTLTINYVDGDNNAVAAAYTGTYNFGAAYSVTSPEVEGYTTETTVVEGTMPAQNTTINVVYTAVSTAKVYELVTTAPADWSGNYVITYSTDAYVLTGVSGSSSGTNAESTANATAFASTGITIADNVMSGVADDYVVTIAASGSYYTIKSASTNAYFGMNSSSYLYAYSSINSTYCMWTPAVNASGLAQFKNSANGNTPYFGWSTSNNHFWGASSSNANVLHLWKETTGTSSVQPAPAEFKTNETTFADVASKAVAKAGSAKAGDIQPMDANSLYELVSPSNLTEGTYLIVYNSGSSYYALTTSYYNTNNSPYFSTALTRTTSGSYYKFSSDLDAYRFTVSGSSGAWKFNNSNVGYLINSGTYPAYSTSGSAYSYSINSSGVMYGSSGSYRYLTVGSSSSRYYLDSSNSSSTGLTFYRLVENTNYTVTFVDWDGTVLDTQTVDEGGSATAPTDPTRTGYTFDHWDGIYTNVTADTRIVAVYTGSTEVWEPTDTIVAGEEYLIGFVIDGNTYLIANTNVYTGYPYITLTSGTQQTNGYYPYYYQEGYTALATKSGNNVIGVNSSGIATDLGVCKWTFSDTTGGTITSVLDSSYHLIYGTATSSTYGYTLYVSAPYDSGSTSWTWNGSTLYSPSSSIYLSYYYFESANMYVVDYDSSAGATIQLYRKQTATTTYTVNFDANEGTLTGASSATYASGATYGSDAAFTSEPTRTGYTFAGWFTDATGGTQVNGTDTVSSNGTLYAHWNINSYTLTINYVYANGGTAAETYTATLAEGATYSVASPTVSGYTPDQATVSGTMGNDDVTVTVTYTQNGGGTVTQMWTPTDTIVPGEPYLIGFVSGNYVYLATNDGQYYANGLHYLGYTARAVLDSDNVISAHVTGLNDFNGIYTDLSSCTWTFSSSTGGTIKSTAATRYLATYSSTSYSDLYAQTSTNNATDWVYDAAEYTLYRVVGSTTRYARGYIVVDDDENALATIMAVSSEAPDDDTVYVQLYALRDVVEGETYTVTFSYYNENGEYVTVTHNNVAYGAEITPPEVPERPGYTFDGWDSEGYLGVTKSHDFIAQYIQNGSMTYTVHLRAVYGTKNTTGTTTIVLNANGLTFTDGVATIMNNLTGGDATPWTGYAKTDETISLGGLDINSAVRIPNGQIFNEFNQQGYTLIGWNTRPDGTGDNYSFTGTGDLDFGGAANKLVYVDNLDRTATNTHINTLYAMWEGSAMFYHSNDNTVENENGTRIFSTYSRQNTGVDIPSLVKTGCLYGGYYTDYAGKGGYTYGTPANDAVTYNDDGIKTTEWNWDDAVTDIPGNAFAFNYNSDAESVAKAGTNAKKYIGKTLYIKEVPDTLYLQPYLHYTYRLGTGIITKIWIVSDFDDVNYNEIGFVLNGESSSANVVTQLTITDSLGNQSVLKPGEMFAAPKGYLSYKAFTTPTDLNGVSILNYWVTPDNLLVTGTNVRNVSGAGNVDTITTTLTGKVASTVGQYVPAN